MWLRPPNCSGLILLIDWRSRQDARAQRARAGNPHYGGVLAPEAVHVSPPPFFVGFILTALAARSKSRRPLPRTFRIFRCRRALTSSRACSTCLCRARGRTLYASCAGDSRDTSTGRGTRTRRRSSRTRCSSHGRASRFGRRR